MLTNILLSISPPGARSSVREACGSILDAAIQGVCQCIARCGPGSLPRAADCEWP